jgi:Rrf2 family iron-sulfur cluster assembly transcriptional regulator
MKLTTKSRCGTRILMDLAFNYGLNPVSVGDISKRQGISVKFVEQVIRPLKKAGFIRSIRGPKGGYCLAKNPEEVNIGQIIRLLETHSELAQCITLPENCARYDDCRVRLVWSKATKMLYSYLDSITLSDLITLPLDEPCEDESINTPLSPQ